MSICNLKMAYEENFQKTSEPKYDCLLFGKKIKIWLLLFWMLNIWFVIEKLWFKVSTFFWLYRHRWYSLPFQFWSCYASQKQHSRYNVHFFLVLILVLKDWFVQCYNLTCLRHCCCVEYMTQKLGIEEDKVQELCLSLYKIYGTTMAGLKVSSVLQ